MKRFSQLLVMAGTAVVLSVSTGSLLAQAPAAPGGGRGNFDPEQFRQRMMERMKEQFEVTNDDEWKLISARIEKVMELRREAGGFGGFAFGRPPGRPGGGDQAQPGGQQGGERNRTRGRGFGGQPNPDAEALQKAIEAKASKEELKEKMDKLRASRKAKEAELEQAQGELRQILNVRQEAIALNMGLLK